MKSGKRKMKWGAVALWVAAGLALGVTAGQVRAQAIEFNGGGADLTWYYESATQTWHTVFRAKGTVGQPTTTVATGLTTPFTGFANIVGHQQPSVPGNTGDYVFSSLTVNVDTPFTQTVGAFNYLITPASGSTIFPADASVPDLGIRTRLRELPGPTDQFADLDLELDWLASTKPAGGEFVLFQSDGSGNVGNVFFNTATANFDSEFPAWGHEHYHWGFSKPGTYTLVFGFEGHGGPYGPTAPGGTVEITFNVIPEPGVVGLALLGIGAILWSKRRRLFSAG